MKTNLVQIRNLKGIIIPKSLIKKFRLDGEIELISSPKGLLIKSSALACENKNESDEWKNISNKFDKKEWSWE